MAELSEYQRRIVSIGLVCLLCFSVYSCGQKQNPMEKIKDLDYTVIAEDNIPEELLLKIEERKTDTFKLTFEDQGFLYICVGYGTPLYETANAVYIYTNLIGPSPEEKSKPVASYPYVVVKTEFSQKPVVFE